MRQMLAVVGLILGNFIAWWLINMLRVPSLINLVLTIMSVVLMLYAMAYFGKTKDKDPSTQRQS